MSIKVKRGVIQLIQSCNKQKAMVLQLGRCPEGMVSLVHAFEKPTVSSQGSVVGRGQVSSQAVRQCLQR